MRDAYAVSGGILERGIDSVGCHQDVLADVVGFKTCLQNDVELRFVIPGGAKGKESGCGRGDRPRVGGDAELELADGVGLG